MKAIIHTPVCPLYGHPQSDCPLIDEALFGTLVEVLSQTSRSFWKVRTSYRYEGFVPESALITDRSEAEWWAALPKRRVLHKPFCDVMNAPTVQSQILYTLPRGSVVAVHGIDQGGWQPVILPDRREGYVRSSVLDSCLIAPPQLPEDILRQRILHTAKSYLGTPYRWGGKTPLGIDCSGLVSMAYLLNGIVIWRDATLREGFPIRAIASEKRKPADLLYFPGHVALYLGDEAYLHATGRAGSDGVVINSLAASAPDYREDLATSLTAVGRWTHFN